MIIERLQYGLTGHITKYADFEARCKQFVQKYAPAGLSVPVDAICKEQFNRWLNTPDLAGYFVAIEQSVIFGHLSSWIVNYYGIPKVFIWQAEIDENTFKPLLATIEAMRSWIVVLNSKLPPECQIKRAELVTWHSFELWRRYLKKAGLDVVQTQNFMEFFL